ncbi:hypothetical protein BDQ17DRAFT_1320867 [Cyathus striatus]|nr:hypothetical protein BDQ17DRAFT_1320867 [Cyathus striatus]
MSSSTSFNVLAIGGSRNIGYYASLRLLAAGATVTFLLRNPSVFDNDTEVQKYINEGKAFLSKGDALVKSNVEHAWEETARNGNKNVDLLLFTVGGTPHFTLAKGTVISPPNLVTQSLLNSSAAYHSRFIDGHNTRITCHSPFRSKAVYGYMIQEPLKDKLGAERALAHVAGWAWEHEEPNEDIIGRDWTSLEGLPSPGEVKRILLIRPAMFTDGQCLAEKEGTNGKAYRVSEQEFRGWTISRKDVAYFVVDAALNRWDEFENKCVSIAY